MSLPDFHPRCGLDLQAVELSVLFGHQIVPGIVLNRGQDLVATLEQRRRHLGHPDGSDLAVG